MKMNPFKDKLTLRESIIYTLGFFATMKRPLTIHEIHIYLWRNNETLENLCESVCMLIAEKKIVSKNIKIKSDTYYTLSKSKECFDFYEDNYKLRSRLLNKAILGSKWIRWIPFVKQIYLCNSLAFDASKNGSDIDYFIITKKNRLFFSRSIITSILSLLKFRRHGKNISEHICLSFFTEEENTNLEKLKLNDDVYLIYWIANLKVLSTNFLNDNIYESNKWIVHYLPNLAHQSPIEINKKIFLFYPFVKLIIEIVLNIMRIASILQYFSKKHQLHRARRKLKGLSKAAKNIVSETMLKFHDEDRREEYRDRWISICNDQLTTSNNQ